MTRNTMTADNCSSVAGRELYVLREVDQGQKKKEIVRGSCSCDSLVKNI